MSMPVRLGIHLETTLTNLSSFLENFSVAVAEGCLLPWMNVLHVLGPVPDVPVAQFTETSQVGLSHTERINNYCLCARVLTKSSQSPHKVSSWRKVSNWRK